VDTKKLVQVRNRMKKVKPKFEMQDVNIYPQFIGRWRRPKGLHSKMRNAFRGHKAMPNIGYSSPKSVKGLNTQGFREVLVTNLKQLNDVPKDNSLIISSKLGTKKKIIIIQKAIELNFNISNLKDPKKYVQNIQEKIESKKKENKTKKQSREKVKEEASKKKEEKESKKEDNKSNEPKK